MRFDDRLSTILTLPADGASAKAAIWGQLVSLLAQKGETISDEQRADALVRATELQNEVPLNRRKFVAGSLSGRITDAETLLLFGQDTAVVAAPALINAQLSEAMWATIIPRLPPTSRALLRGRRDLTETVTRMLGFYGTTDNALPSLNSADEATSDEAKPIEIRDLVARIEAFKQEREVSGAKPTAGPQRDATATSFRFESDRAGLICWVEGAARGALIGISLAEMAEPRSFGVDGHAAGAFRKRTAFRTARLLVAGGGPASGDWLISADPTFDPEDGRFRGYRGLARRAEPSEQASALAINPLGNDMSSDSVRQLVHELRSPLNAIRGFSEMIDGQLLGPVSHAYRQKARSIIEDSSRLVRIVDDIDMAARLGSETNLTPVNEAIDVTSTARSAIEQFAQQCARFNITLMLDAEAEEAWSAIEQNSGARLIERLIATIIGIAEPGEWLAMNISNRTRGVFVTVDRPRLLGTDIDLKTGDLSKESQARCSDPPALGLSFAIRLIRQMAEAIGGQFRIEAEKFVLILPPAHDTEGKTKESG